MFTALLVRSALHAEKKKKATRESINIKNMTDYMEYIKGGDILIAPSLDYKHQYILKCGLCEDYYGDFEQFFTHYLNHYDMDSNEEDNMSQSGIMDDQQFYDDIIVDEGGDGMSEAANDDDPPITEQMSDTEEEVTISSLKQEIDDDDDDIVQTEADLQEFDTNCMSTYNANNSEHESLEIEELASNSTDIQSQYAELDDESHEVEKSHEEDFVKQFLKSKENVMAFIAAYRKQPQLWNFNHPVQCRQKPERAAAWQEIATDFRKTRNIPILSNQVAAVIIYLRQKYREMKVNVESSETKNNQILPLWMSKQLSFLKPFMETEPISILDAHQDLSPQQIIQILGILERCPHIWDANTIEYYCNNKRNEAITHMKNIINEEIDLDVDECTLKRYLRALQDYFVFQKRRHMGYVKGKKVKSKYYQHMLFLYDHMGPFQCTHCRRTLFNPLQFKVHTSLHDGTIPLNCYVCNKDFKIAETYLYHIRRHMDDLKQECTECGRKFMRTAELTSHMRCHTGDKPYCCDVCGSSFRHRTGFNLHKKRHDKKYIAFCPYCSKGFYSKATLDIHIRTHKDERDFVCPTCGKAFKTQTTLKSHIATHENGSYECMLCGKTFKNRINLAQHKRKHGIKPDPQLKSELLSVFDLK